MTQEEKELLLKDICARLPYGVKVYALFDEEKPLTREMGLGTLHDFMLDNIEVKPYLRPMSSITDEEYDELCECTKSKFIGDSKEIDWLNKHHFDYRGLIEKGLALEAKEGMY